MRLRTWWGINLQRITLHAFNAPLLRTSASELHFGYCVPKKIKKNFQNKNNTSTKETKENVHQINELENKLENHLVHSVFRTLVVTNVGAIRSNCMVQMPLDADLHGCFQVKPTYAVLEPGSTQIFVVEFAPIIHQNRNQKLNNKSNNTISNLQDKQYFGTLNIVGTGNETYPVTLNGTAGSWLQLSTKNTATSTNSTTKQINYGQIDNLGSVVTRLANQKAKKRGPSRMKTHCRLLYLFLLPLSTGYIFYRFVSLLSLKHPNKSFFNFHFWTLFFV